MLKLKEIREDKKLQQKDIAKELKRTVACISSWETGKTEPSLDDIIRLSNVLDVSIDYLLGKTDEFGITQNDILYTKVEKNIIKALSSLSNEEQYQVLGYIQAIEKNKD